MHRCWWCRYILCFFSKYFWIAYSSWLFVFVSCSYIFTSLQCLLCLQTLFFVWTGLPEGSFFLFSVVCSISPYLAMSSVSDYKVRKRGRGGSGEETSETSIIVFKMLCVQNVVLWGKHLSVCLTLDDVVKHYFYQVKKFTSKSTKYFLFQN